MFHSYLSAYLSPQTLLCKCFSKGRTGWNFDSARSHSSQSHCFSAALSSCGTLWAHRLWGKGSSHHFQKIPAIPLHSVTCALLPESEREPPLSSSTGRARPFWWQLSPPFSFGSGLRLSSKSSDLSQALLSEKSPFVSSSEASGLLFLSVVRLVSLVRWEELISVGAVMPGGLSLGELKTIPPASTTGLLTEIGLLKADSQLEERDPDLCFILLAFYLLALGGGGTGLGTRFL